jgi:DNA-binding MarR family transcriptional regulator
MVDDSKLPFPDQNIRSLLNAVILSLDSRLRELRKDTRYSGVRNSDVKVFMSAFRASGTIAEIARALDVSRQAVHASVKRLQAIKVVELQPVPNNSRDKLVVMTERGRHAQQTAWDQINTIEKEMAAVIGTKALQQMRQSLSLLAQSSVTQSGNSERRSTRQATGVKSS